MFYMYNMLVTANKRTVNSFQNISIKDKNHWNYFLWKRQYATWTLNPNKNAIKKRNVWTHTTNSCPRHRAFSLCKRLFCMLYVHQCIRMTLSKSECRHQNRLHHHKQRTENTRRLMFSGVLFGCSGKAELMSKKSVWRRRNI